MKNKDIIKAVEYWQSMGILHPMTCGVDSNHEVLKPKVIKGKVRLICPTCGYTQEHVPPIVLKAYEDKIKYNGGVD